MVQEKDTTDDGGPTKECSEGLSYLEELRLAKIVRKRMVGNGMHSSRDLFAGHRSGSTRASLTRNISFRDGTKRTRPSLASDLSAWTSMSMKKSLKGDFESESGVDKKPRAVSNGRTSSAVRENWRRSTTSDSGAWKSMAKFVVELDCDSDSESNSHIGNAYDLEDENHSEVYPLYAKPVQRQLWGDPHLVVRNVVMTSVLYCSARQYVTVLSRVTYLFQAIICVVLHLRFLLLYNRFILDGTHWYAKYS